MSQLLENTYEAYNRFLEGELNQYDLMSLIEDEIISGEVLESMLEEGFLSNTMGKIKKHALPLATAGALAAGSMTVSPFVGFKPSANIANHIANYKQTNHQNNAIKNNYKDIIQNGKKMLVNKEKAFNDALRNNTDNIRDRMEDSIRKITNMKRKLY